MKKRIFSRFLALFMALSLLTTTVFAASLDDLQAAIDGTNDVEVTETTKPVEDAQPADQMPEAADPTADPAAESTETPEPEDTTHVNGALVRQDKDEEGNVTQNYFGYGWSSTVDENQNTTWSYAIEAHDADGNRYVVLLDNVDGSGTASGVVIGQDGGSKNVTIDMNDHNITGNGKDAVIKVETDAALNLSNGAVSGGEVGIDVFGSLILDSVMVSRNGTGIKINENGKVTFNGDKNAVNGNTTKNLSGTGKVTFTLGDQEYQVDVDTAETLLAGEDSIAAYGKDWILAKNDTETYTVVYTGTGVKFEGTDNWLSQGIVNGILDNGEVSGKKVSCFIVPDAIKTIGYNAFANRKDIQEVQLKSGLTTIQKAAFSGCSGLETINIPETVTMINDNAFTNCAILEKIELPSGLTALGHSVFKNCTNLKGVVTIPAGVTAIGTETFLGCASLEGITFAEDSKCTKIGVSAFYNCKGLTGTVVIPEGVTVIETQAFKLCAGLEGIQLKGNVTTINSSAFSSCSNLKSINIPDTVTTIGNGAFGGCKELTSVELPEGLTTLGSDVFKNCAKLTGTVTIPAGLTKIDNSVFYGCKSLEGVVFADNSQCTSIDDCAFYNCEGIKSITIPEGVTTIKRLAFYLCRGLETVELKDGVTSLGMQAFSGCPKLTSINIPETVTSIGDQAFYMSRSLKTITIPAGVKEFGRQVFYDGKGFPKSVVKSVWIPSEEGSAETAALVASKTDVNIFVRDDTENLSFYRGEVTADFGHYSADNDVNLDDGSVALTGVSGTITTDSETVTLPDVAGITASISTDGNIVVRVPGAITVGDEACPYGATVTINPDGTISVERYPAPPVTEEPDTGIILLPDSALDAAGTTIDDQAVPLAGLMPLAQLLEELWQYEEIEDAELPEDFKWFDHEYAQAIYWGLEEGLVVDTEEEPLDPDEVLTVDLMRGVLTNFVELYLDLDGFAVDLDGEDDEIVFDLGERLTAFYAELEAFLEDKAA